MSGDSVRACVFDAYGTLFDVHSAVRRHAPALGEAAEAMSALWRAKQLEYSWVRSLVGRHADFWALTGEALDFALARFGVADPPLRAALMDAYLRLDAFPEVPGTLARLREAGLGLAVLSNGSPAMLAVAVGSAGLAGLFDHVLSIEEVGVYKPDPRVYRLATARLGLAADEIAFLSSNGWDIAGAGAFGFRTFWIDSAGGPPEYAFVPPAAELRDLSALPALLGA